MPEISRFYGITVKFFYKDHNPPHFHVEYSGQEAVFSIETLEIIEGKIPKKQALLVVQWTFLHRKELMEAWKAVRNNQEPNKIKPLK